jgi:hypothetical protein
MRISDRISWLRSYKEYYGEWPRGDKVIRPFHAMATNVQMMLARTQRTGVNSIARHNGVTPSQAVREHILAFLEARYHQKTCHSCMNIIGPRCVCQECVTCHNRNRASHICRHCGKCKDCCTCPICRECGVLETACVCPKDRITAHNPPLKFLGDATPMFQRHAGVEIEFGYDEGSDARPFNKAVRKWGCHPHADGSIRDYGKTCEVSTPPARGDVFVEMMTEVCETLRTMGARANKSCGLHVHVNVKDLTGLQLLGLIRLYAKVEQGLYSVVAPSRYRADYCKPWGSDFEFAKVLDLKATVAERSDRLDSLLYGTLGEAKKIKANKVKHNVRYHGLNLNSIILYGTLEFRLHHGTTNLQKILNWTAVCQALIAYAVEHDEATIKGLSGDPFEMLCHVVKEKPLVRWLRLRREHFSKTSLAERGLGKAPNPMADHEESEACPGQPGQHDPAHDTNPNDDLRCNACGGDDDLPRDRCGCSCHRGTL